MNLRFETIDLSSHSDVAVAYRRDAYRVAFGSTRRFDDVVGGQAYLEWLRCRIERSPGGQVHVWAGDTIIGQIEARPHRRDGSAGFVNLYYLAPQWRGRGFGAALDAYTSGYFRSLGITRVTLHVSETNLRALRFYRRLGWHHHGVGDATTGQLEMRRLLTPASVSPNRPSS